MLVNFNKFIIQTWKDIRIVRDKIVYKIFKPVIQIGFPADIVTFIGFIFGIVSVFFLGKSNILFSSFYILQRLADIIDGPFYRFNKVELIKGIDMDRFSDFSFAIILFIVSIQFTGPLLPILTIITYVFT